MTLNAKDAVYEGLKRLRAEGKRFFSLEDLKQRMPACTIGRAWMTQCLNELGCTYDRKMAFWTDQKACIADAEYAPYRSKEDPKALVKQLAENNADIEYLKATVVDLTFRNKELTEENNSLKNRVHHLRGDLNVQEDMIRNLQEFIKKFVEGLGQPDSTLLFIFGRLQAILSKTDSVETVDPPKVRSQKKILEEKLKQVQDKVGEMVTALIHDDYCKGCKKTFFCKQYNLSNDAPANWLGVLPICKAHQDLIGDVTELHSMLEEGDYEQQSI